MARTKASLGTKVASGKSNKARCSAPPPPDSSAGLGSRERSQSSIGGNRVCPRDTPIWQKPITSFFVNKDIGETDGSGSSEQIDTGSVLKKSEMVITESDDEMERPTNSVLDETIELEPLNGEGSHKIDEYYTVKGEKEKGKRKNTNKEHLDNNAKRASKRSRENGESEQSSRKKNKVSI